MIQALQQKMKEQKGFTLIELLAVIVILGIIAAIAIPAISNVINKSDNKAKVQDALLVIDAAKLYVTDHNPTATLYLTLNGTGNGAADTTPAGLSSYLDRVKDPGFIVKVSYTAPTNTSGAKYTYEISKHDAVTVLGGTKASTYESEADLLAHQE